MGSRSCFLPFSQHLAISLGNKPLQNGVCFFVVFYLRKDFLSVDLDREERQKYPFPSLQIKYHIQEKGKLCALLSANHRQDKNLDAIFKGTNFIFLRFVLDLT